MSRTRGLFVALVAMALQAGGFDPVKDVPMTVSGAVLTVTIPPGAHLKAALFKVALGSGGHLELEALPVPTGKDEAGDPIWRGTLLVGLKARDLEDPARLVVTYQPCTEGPDGMCYLPVKRTLTLPASAFMPRP